MKAVFTTAFERLADAQHVPKAPPAHAMRVVESNLQLLFPDAIVLVYSVDHKVVAELQDSKGTLELPADVHATVQRFLDDASEVVVFVPHAHAEMPPMWYQAYMLQYIQLPGTSIHVPKLLNLPIVFSKLLDYEELTETITTTLQQWWQQGYVMVAGDWVQLQDPYSLLYTPTPAHAVSPSTSLNVVPTEQALQALAALVWERPSEVEGVWSSHTHSVEWLEAGTLDPYRGTQRAGAPSTVDISNLPANHVVLGTEAWIAPKLQKLVGRPLEIKVWNGVRLVEANELAPKLQMLARTLSTHTFTPPQGLTWPWKTEGGMDVVVSGGEHTRAWTAAAVRGAPLPPSTARWIPETDDEFSVQAQLFAVGSSLRPSHRVIPWLRPDLPGLVQLWIDSADAADAWDGAWQEHTPLELSESGGDGLAPLHVPVQGMGTRTLWRPAAARPAAAAVQQPWENIDAFYASVGF